jgi:hypothetical protein
MTVPKGFFLFIRTSTVSLSAPSSTRSSFVNTPIVLFPNGSNFWARSKTSMVAISYNFDNYI